MKIMCVVGLPGSGKTHHVRQHMGPNDWFWDDPRHSYHMPDQHLIVQSAVEPFTFWIADPHFCKTSVRQKAEQILQDEYGVTPDWIYFENNPEQCRQNVLARADGRKVLGMIHAMSSVYEIPPGAQVLPVYKP